MVAEENDSLLCCSSFAQWICSESSSPLGSEYPQNHSDCLWVALGATFPAFRLRSESCIKVNVAFSAIFLPPSNLLIEFNCSLKHHLPSKHYVNFMHKSKMRKLISVRHGRAGRGSSCECLVKLGAINTVLQGMSQEWN